MHEFPSLRNLLVMILALYTMYNVCDYVFQIIKIMADYSFLWPDVSNIVRLSICIYI